MLPVKKSPPQPGLAAAWHRTPTRSARYVTLQTNDEDTRVGAMAHADEPSVVVAAEPFPLRETWRQRVWRLLVETANPRTTHTEDLTPAERLKQASFESLDYYKSYPAMYLRHLRNKKKRKPGNVVTDEAMQPSPAVRAAAAGRDGRGTGTGTGTGDDGDGEGSRTKRRETVEEGEGGGLGALLSGSTMSRINISLPTDEEERHTALRWFLHVLIALSVGVVATVVSYAVDIIESYRANTLSRVIHGAPFRIAGYAAGFVVWLLMSVLLVAVATGVVVYFEPAASGGGIPDVMAYLNGVHMRHALNVKTFVAKAVSCVCAVAGGLPVGLEAPLIHLGAITGAGVTQGRSRSLGFQTPFFQAFRNNKDRRDFITAGAACGVSAAFGAPIGGLLFVMEEVSSFWDHSASGQIFLATMICFTVTTIINSLVEDNRLLGWVSNTASVLFEVNLTIPLNLISIVPSLFLGAILGALAAFFTKVNLILIKWRRGVLRPYPLRRFLEPVLVVAVYSTLMYLFTMLSDCRILKAIEDVNATARVWGTEGAGRLFNDTCPVPGEYSPLGTLNMATGKNMIRHLFTRQTVGEFPVYYLLLHFMLYFTFACVSSGMAISGGLVVPSLVIGAIFGRLYGLLLWYVAAHKDVVPGVDRSYSSTDAWMDPGVFALIGAGAFLAGTSRMAMSICVIMVELSSELHYLLPVMVAIVMSKTVADWLCEPLYHEMLHLDSVPYLGASLALPEFEQLTAADVMATNVVVLRRREKTEVVQRALRDTTHHAFPVVVEVYGDDDDDKAKRGAAGGDAQRNAQQQQQGKRREEEEEEGGNSGGGWATHSPTRIRGLENFSSRPCASALLAPKTHMKFVGLVTREDLQVYFTLPQLRGYEPSVEASLAQQVSQRYSGARGEDYDDGFGGRLAQCVVDINRLTWTQWLMHKTSLFLGTGDRYDWVRRNVPPGATPSQETLEKDGEGKDESGGGGPLLPPVLDLSIIINRSPWVITPAFNLQMAYHTFRTMGLRHMVVVDGDVVKGMITRKDLLVDALRRRMKELRTRLNHRDPTAQQAAEESGRGSGGGGHPDVPPLDDRGEEILHELVNASPGPSQMRGPGAARTAGMGGALPAPPPPATLLWDD